MLDTGLSRKVGEGLKKMPIRGCEGFVDYDIVTMVGNYFHERGLKWPENADEALMWAQTELAEAYELLLARKGGWTRNNPEEHPPFDNQKLAEELGDAIMMIIVAGIVEGIFPLAALRRKIECKLAQLSDSS